MEHTENLFLFHTGSEQRLISGAELPQCRPEQAMMMLHHVLCVERRTASSQPVPKSKSSRREISLAQELVDELKVWELRCPKSARDQVLATEEGKPMHRKAISKILDAAIEKAEMKRLTPHGLRHTFASLLLADGVDIAELLHLLGHKNPAITLRIYSHFVHRETKSVQNLASSILGGGKP